MLESATKTYPLTTIDVANLCPKPSGQRHRELLDWRPPARWISYAPTRDSWAKLLSREPSLPLDLLGDRKAALLASIARQCRYGEHDIAANLAVSEALWDWAKECNATSVSHEFRPYRTPLAVNRVFEEGIIVVEDRGLAVFLDPRRSSTCLTSAGREFLYSAQYWRLHGIADYEDVQPVVIGLTDSVMGRKVKVFEFEGEPLYSADEVLERIEETQRIWLDVQLARRETASKSA